MSLVYIVTLTEVQNNVPTQWLFSRLTAAEQCAAARRAGAYDGTGVWEMLPAHHERHRTLSDSMPGTQLFVWECKKYGDLLTIQQCLVK